MVFGGASTSVHDVVQQFFPATGRSRVIATMPTVRADVTTAVAAGRVVLVGGFDGIGPQSSVWATRDGRHFTVVAHLPRPVRYPAVAALGANVYAVGGLLSGGEYTGTFTSDIQRIDLRTGNARIVGRLSSPIAHAMATTVNGRIYLLGGSTPSGAERNRAPTRSCLRPNEHRRPPTPPTHRRRRGLVQIDHLPVRRHLPGTARHDPRRPPTLTAAGDAIRGRVP